MNNEILYVLTALWDISFVIYASRKSVEWLYATIITNLILIAVLGVKLVTVFGLVTNAGNIFYACVFFATYLIFEAYGRNTALKTIPVGIVYTAFFVMSAYFVNEMVGAPITDDISKVIAFIFPYSLRVIFASLVSYLCAQYINISTFEWIKNKTQGRLLWLRINGANAVGQFVDSMIFFSIVFSDLPGILLIQTIVIGWCIKMCVVLLGTVCLYTKNFLNNKHI